MTKPTFEILRLGPARFELVVRNSVEMPELHEAIESLGYEPTPGQSNRRSVTVTSASEMDAKRNPLAKFFAR